MNKNKIALNTSSIIFMFAGLNFLLLLWQRFDLTMLLPVLCWRMALELGHLDVG